MLNWHDFEDDQLIQFARDGQADAFGELYERHINSVYRFLYARLDNHLDAEDFAEEVFWKAWNSLPGYNERGVPFLAYLLIIARNVLIDHYRRNGRSPQKVSLEDIQVSDHNTDPGELTDTHLNHQELRQAMAELRDEYQEVLVLRFLNEMSPKETAKVMKRSTGAVRVLQHRALAALRKSLDEKKYDQRIR